MTPSPSPARAATAACGTADSFLVTVNGTVVDVTLDPAAPGSAQSFRLPFVPGPGASVTVQAVDAAGNISPPATVRVAGLVAEQPRPAPLPEFLPATGGNGPVGGVAGGDLGLLLLGLCIVGRAVRHRSCKDRG